LHPVSYSKQNYVFCVITNVSNYSKGKSHFKVLKKYSNTLKSVTFYAILFKLIIRGGADG
jgi:hypothetical protein